MVRLDGTATDRVLYASAGTFPKQLFTKLQMAPAEFAAPRLQLNTLLTQLT